MSKNISVERHGDGWCLKDSLGNLLIVTPERTGLDRILRQMDISEAADKFLATKSGASKTFTSNFILSLR